MQGTPIPSTRDRISSIVRSLYPAARSQTSLPHDLLGGFPRITRSVETSGTILADDADAVLFGTVGAARQGEQRGINGEPSCIPNNDAVRTGIRRSR